MYDVSGLPVMPDVVCGCASLLTAQAIQKKTVAAFMTLFFITVLFASFVLGVMKLKYLVNIMMKHFVKRRVHAKPACPVGRAQQARREGL